ncbi:S8/S53 family peptidase [Chondromyces crocatus]|uniref:Peptidase S8/S53 domain-containing protein n=1 Tax=Chondromyces crocatus TaxID=52 RepID=A0A0K1EN61_CHOCO|nr:S8/S53 family peptidase [Chondromyces crocatus]AKT42365.1 uncharacterized protein CMC5_065910 [Chondromyces crocatus]
MEHLPPTPILACALAGLLTAACSELHEPEPPPDPTAEPGTLTLTGAHPLASTTGPLGCTGRRWIAHIPPPGTCPAPPLGWIMAPLFGAAAPPGLSSLCLYDHAGLPGPVPPQPITALHTALTTQGATAIEEDCVVVEPLAGQLQAASRPWLHDQLLAQLDASGPLPQGGTPSPVAIAVADTSPDARPDGVTGSIPRGRLDHGYTMAWLARDLACPAGGPCTAYLSTQLALPHIDNATVDLAQGGYFGTRGQLAQAIHRAVDAWKAAYPAQRRLVINLSVGWEPDAGCGDPSAPELLPLPERAVLLALQHAACHGALLIAAAGNDPGGPEPHYPAGTPMPSGPTCPAAWSVEPAPSSSRCTDLEGTGYATPFSALPLRYTPPSPPEAPGAPIDDALLFAVGGVDHADRPIVRARPEGNPRLAALALHGTAGQPGLSLPAPLTGTSVAAAAVSGIAAATWAYRPDLTATEIMDLVYRAGPILSRKADFHASGVSDLVRRVTRCRALAAACPPGGGTSTCPPTGVPCASFPPPQPAQNPSWTPSLLSALATDLATAPPLFGPHTRLDVLPEPRRYRSLAAAPWVHPQPERPPCGACIFQPSNGSLYIEIASDYPQRRVLTQTTLTLTGPEFLGQRPRTVSYALVPLRQIRASTEPFSIMDIAWSSDLSSVQSASIAWVVTDTETDETSSVTEQILIRR